MKARHPIHPLGTYFIHGDGKPRRVQILEVDRDKDRVKIRDRASVYWIASKHLSRSAKPAPARAAAKRHRQDLYETSLIKGRSRTR